MFFVFLNVLLFEAGKIIRKKLKKIKSMLLELIYISLASIILHLLVVKRLRS